MKKLLMLMAMVFMASVVSAQIAVEKPKITDNVSIGVQVGATTPLNNAFPLNTSAGVKVGKQFNPIVGMNLEGDAIFGSQSYPGKNIVRATNIGLNGIVDILNLINTKESRKFTVVTETGFGWLHNFSNTNDDLTAKTGVQLAYNPSRKITVYAEPLVFWNLDNKVQFNKSRANAGLQVGVTYHLKNSNGRHGWKFYDVGAMNDEINNLRAQLNEKPTEVIKEVEKVVEIEKIKEVEIESYNRIVFFAFDSAELSTATKVILDEIPVTTEVSVYGYASPEGTKKHNWNLSNDRAAAVANYLQDRGVRVNDVEGCGSEDDTTGRVVIVIAK